MAVERVATGFRWAEGPVYFPAGRYVLFSDIPNNRIMRFSEDDGHVSVFRQPSMNSNGNTIDREGRLITCEHSGRRVTRTELDGSITVIADKYNGKRLNSPNDAAVASDGAIWFTDPVYGIGGNYEGVKSPPEQEKHNVYRVDPKSGDIKVVVDDFVEPNGIAFSPDEKKLYVIDTGYTDGPNNPSHVRVFDVDNEGGKVSNGRVFAEMPKPSITDGVRTDTAGNVWCSCGWGDPTTTASAATIQTATYSAKFISPRRSPICVLAVPSETDCIFAALPRSTPFIQRTRRPQAVMRCKRCRAAYAGALPGGPPRSDPDVWLLRMAEHTGGQAALVFHRLRWLAASHGRWALGRMERPRDGRDVEVLHDDSDRAQRVRCGNPRPHASVFDEGSIRAVAKRQGGL